MPKMNPPMMLQKGANLTVQFDSPPSRRSHWHAAEAIHILDKIRADHRYGNGER
jgi:hypothetical protein